MKIRILASYGGDLQCIAEDIEKRINEFLEDLSRRRCTVHRVEVNHQMVEGAFSILAIVMYTCREIK